MSYFRNVIARLRRGSEEGATAVEYGVMVALIAAVIVAIVLLLGRQVRTGFCNTSYNLQEAEDNNGTAPNTTEALGNPTGCTNPASN